jgi:hypothetical protein
MVRLTLILFSISLASRAADLTGRWRSTQVSPTGVSAVFEFHGANELDSYSAAISEENYRLIGTDTIALQSKAGEEKQELEWDGEDRARIEDEAAGKAIKLDRVGKIADKQNPLLGEWSTTREWNGKSYAARAVFLSGGKVVWTITLRTERGHYTVQEQNIRIEMPGRPIVEGKFSLPMVA